MDNLPIQPPTQPVAPQPSSRRNIIIISVLVLIALLLGGIFYINSKKSSPKPIQVEKPAFTPTPQPSIKISTNRGIITAIDDQNISIKAGTNTATFSLKQAKDIQKVTSGTLESGKVKTAPAKLSDLKVGQEVLIVAEKDSTIARSILIIK